MKKNCYDQYAGTVFKVIKVFFRYLLLEKALPVGEFYKRFRVPVRRYNPVILSPMQLRFLITDTEFGRSLSPSLKRVKDIFVFGCTVALRYSDLMRLRKTNIQDGEEGVYVVLHTGKTGSEIRVPLPVYARDIISRYRKATGVYLLPRLSVSNLNLGIKALVKKAGWDHYLPKIRYRRGVAVEVKTSLGKTFRFYDHMTAHTMRQTAITTLLLLGVDENSVRGISGHAPGSREFYRYVALVQEYFDERVKAAHQKLVDGAGTGGTAPAYRAGEPDGRRGGHGGGHSPHAGRPGPISPERPPVVNSSSPQSGCPLTNGESDLRT